MPANYIIIGCIFLFSFVYIIYSTSKRKQVMASVNMEDEKRNAPEYFDDFIENKYSFLKKWMDGATINAFTSAEIPTTTGDEIKGMAKNIAKSAAWALIGAKVKYHTAETLCYVVLSGADMHFFSTDTDGNMESHIIFDAFQLKAATIQYIKQSLQESKFISQGSKDMLPEKFVITLSKNGETFSLNIMDRIKKLPETSDIYNVKKMLETNIKNIIVGNVFLDKLSAKYPNLKASKN